VQKRETMAESWPEYRSDVIGPRVLAVRTLARAGTGQVVGLALTNLVLGALPVLYVVASSVFLGHVLRVLDGSFRGDEWHAIALPFLLTAGLFVAQQVLVPLQSLLDERMRQSVDGQTYRRLIATSLRVKGLAPMEEQSNLALLATAAEQLEFGWATPGKACAGTMAYIARYTRLAGFVGLICLDDTIWAGLAVGCATMVFRYAQRGGLRAYANEWKVTAALRRESDYFRELGLSARAAKETRIFGAAPLIAARYSDSQMQALRPFWARRRQVMGWRFLCYTLIGLGVDCTVLGFAMSSAAHGHIPVTQLAIVCQSVVGAVLLGEFYHEADSFAQFGMECIRALDDLDDIVTSIASAEEPREIRQDTHRLPTQSIRFDDVTFSYSGAEQPVIKGLTLTLKAGKCTAIVGVNGSGKTTVIKLLTRLYEPTSGQLLVDGTPVSEFDVDAWRRLVSVVFQDFNRYELSLSDNVTFGSGSRQPDVNAASAAVAAAGLSEVVRTLPRGLETPLSQRYKTGVEFSGGQWQRVALARSLYALSGGARVLVLDEPTAALDARAELAFFDRFIGTTRGTTTVLISHRFSTVRRADHIVVLADGMAAEEGTHQELMRNGGLYADMFHTQADRFGEAQDAHADGAR
jgi:ATP-binding cassette subfamily B protein